MVANLKIDVTHSLRYFTHNIFLVVDDTVPIYMFTVSLGLTTPYSLETYHFMSIL